MDIGSHLPAYLLCEKFAAGGVVADLFPPDGRGVDFIAATAKKIIVVHSAASRHDTSAGGSVQHVKASPTALPLSCGAFDLVLSLGYEPAHGSFEDVLRSARMLLNPAGVLAVAIPNRDAALLETSLRNSKLLDFLEFERGLRRHFPHVFIFAQHPLHGAILSPLGRRQSGDGPLLDDRLIPKGGEAPTHFFALCSPRYRRVDETTIAQLPFSALAHRIRFEIERLEGSLAIVERENDTRGKEVALLSGRLEEARAALARAEMEGRERSIAEAEMTALRERLARREQLVKELEAAAARNHAEIIEQKTSCREAERKVRKLEADLIDARRASELAVADREEIDRSRQALLEQLHEVSNEAKAKQREIDDRIEQVAGAEAELAALHKEASKQRRELIAAREQIRKLGLQIQELEEAGGSPSALETELERLRTAAAAERERLEKRADEEHRQLLEEIGRKETARREARALEVRLEEAGLSLGAAQTRNQQLVEQLERANAEISNRERERDEALEEARRAQRAAEELGAMIREKADDFDRQLHAAELLEARAREAEERRDVFETRVTALNAALDKVEEAAATATLELAAEHGKVTALEARLLTRDSELEEEIERSTTLESRLAAASDRIANLDEELASAHRWIAALEADLADSRERVDALENRVAALQPDASASKTARQRAMAAEAAVSDLENVNDQLRGEVEDARSRAAHLEKSLGLAEARIEEAEEEKRRLEEALDGAREEERRAKEALLTVESAGGSDARTEELIAAMKARIARLTEENENELERVREDLETELRHANAVLEARHGELWELREEVIRLRAQTAASVANAQERGLDVEIQRSMVEQENLIEQLKEERDDLRVLTERQARSLEVRKKNLKILAALLRKERALGHQPQPRRGSSPAPRGDTIPAPSPTRLDIRALIEEAGVVISEEAFEGFDEALDDDFLDSLSPHRGDPSGAFGAGEEEADLSPDTAAEVDGVMDSVVVEVGLKAEPRRISPKKEDR